MATPRDPHAPLLVAVSPLIAERYGERIRSVAPAIDLISPGEGGWPAAAQEAEVIYFSEDYWTSEATRALLPQLFMLPKMRWFHSFSAGVDHPAFRLLIERGVRLTNSVGTTNEPIAQYVIGMMLRVAKRMDAWSEAQRERRWQAIDTAELTGMTAGIIGLGHIGGEVARLAKAFRMEVLGWRRRPRRPRHVDELVPHDRLDELLRRSDFVVLAVPLSSETDRLIGASELAAMRSDAWLINISRGQVIDEVALAAALKEGAIGGACLDVFEEEPLPVDHELWSLPNVIVTPHNSGRSPLNLARGSELFLDNLTRYVAGKPLRNPVRLSDI